MRPHRAEQLARILLWFYPPSFRRQFGAEVLQFTRTAAAENTTRAAIWMVGLDGLRSLPREWRAALTSRGGPALPHHSSFGDPMRTLLADLAHAVRLLAKSPTFTGAAVVTLALGIGANTAIFTLADAVLFRPVQVRAPHQLFVWSWTSSYPDFQQYARQTELFDGVAAISGVRRLHVAVGGTSDLATSSFVGGNTFEVLGVRAAHGRVLLPSDDVANGPIAAVLSHDYWWSRFGAAPGIVGATVRANGKPVTIVGVLQQGFRGVTVSSNPGLYLPAGAFNQVQTGFFARQNALTNTGFVWLNVIARLRPGVSVEQVNERMTVLYGQLHPRKTDDPPERLNLTPLLERALGRSADEARTFVTLLMAVVGMTLLIGCTNLANLLLARAASRRREMGVRMALGASRGRVLRQMLTESVLLAGIGGTVGLAVAAAAVNVLSSYDLPGGLAIREMGLELNRTALAVTLGLSVVTGLLFGIMPAWRASRIDVLVSLRDSGRVTTSRSTVRSVLLGAQVALCLVLLAGTALFARTLQQALNRPLGLDARGVVAASVNVGLARYDEERAGAFYADTMARVRALPQVISAAWASMIPTRGSWVQELSIQPAGDAALTAHVNVAHVGPAFFRTLGTKLLSGREFSDEDRGASHTVAIINHAMAGKYWGDRDPLGDRVGGNSPATVIGVVENIVDDAMDGEPAPFVYFAFNQSLSGPESLATDRAHLLVRTRGDAEDAVGLVGEQLRAFDPELPLFDLQPFEDRLLVLLMPQRMGFALFAIFSTVAIGLASVGIYGVAAYVAAQRTREIGVRVALGASAGDILRMVLAQAGQPVAVGIVVGLALALYFGRTMGAFLMDVSPFDPPAFVTATAVLATVALGATYLPARRASQIEPVQALRDE